MNLFKDIVTPSEVGGGDAVRYELYDRVSGEVSIKRGVQVVNAVAEDLESFINGYTGEKVHYIITNNESRI